MWKPIKYPNPNGGYKVEGQCLSNVLIAKWELADDSISEPSILIDALWGIDTQMDYERIERMF